jgi:hypothetical protein
VEPPAEIAVTREDVDRFLSRFTVVVTDPDGSSEHLVTLTGPDWARLGRGYRSPEELVRACFAFLLAREPRAAILGAFDVSEIGGYFPEFEEAIARRPD